MQKYYVTAPIYYASGELHLGHVYTSTACDILARWNRVLGKNVFFLTGSDEHGQKVAKAAKEKGVTEQQFVDPIVESFKKTHASANISSDFFIRTTDENHKLFVQAMLQRAYDNGDIYKAMYKGKYCVDCERYFKDDELNDGNCPIHKRKVLEVEEENYFFKLSKYQNILLKFYDENPNFLSPSTRALEIINRVKGGLEDISISRSKKTLTWGIELPFDKNHVAYVWFDALFNYVSAIENTQRADFWPAQVHVVGKDIYWFHTVYWPAFLLSCGYQLPERVFAHGWWTVNGEKMGKSMNNQVDPIAVAQKFGLDAFRYYMFSVSPFGEDVDFNEKLLISKINNELNDDLGNLVSRVHTLVTKNFPEGMAQFGLLDKVDEEMIKSLHIQEEFTQLMINCEITKALELVWKKLRELNAYINVVQPWKETSIPRLAVILHVLVGALHELSWYIEPFMPTKAKEIRTQFKFDETPCLKFDVVEEGHTLGEKKNIFEKIKLEEKKVEPVKIEKKTGFSALCLKLGKVISVKPHPEAEKLFVEEIDLGEGRLRTIVSGLKAHYTVEEFVGKTVVVVANLKPAKLRGIMSEGMVLAGENSDGRVGLILSTEAIGTNLSSDNVLANNTAQITVDEFFKYKFEMTATGLTCDNKEVLANGKKLSCDKGIIGNVK